MHTFQQKHQVQNLTGRQTATSSFLCVTVTVKETAGDSSKSDTEDCRRPPVQEPVVWVL